MRIRSIKPEFWRSLDIAAIEDWGDRLLFIGLWSYVDDNGVGSDRVSLIAADLFAEDLERDPSETFARVSRGLRKLEELGRIVRYSFDGRDYVFVNGWGKHQRIDHPNEPRYPLPSGEIAHPARENTGTRAKRAKPSRKSRETLAPGTGEQRNRGTEEQGANAPRARAQRGQPTFTEQLRGEPDPVPDAPPEDPQARPTANTTAAELIRAVIPANRYAKATETELRLRVGELLAAGEDPELIREALRLWNERGGGVGLLPHLLADAAKNLRPVPVGATGGPPTAFERKSAQNAAVFERLLNEPGEPQKELAR